MEEQIIVSRVGKRRRSSYSGGENLPEYVVGRLSAMMSKAIRASSFGYDIYEIATRRCAIEWNLYVNQIKTHVVKHYNFLELLMATSTPPTPPYYY